MFKVNKKFKTSRIILLIQSTRLIIVYNYWINHRSVRREWIMKLRNVNTKLYKKIKNKHWVGELSIIQRLMPPIWTGGGGSSDQCSHYLKYKL